MRLLRLPIDVLQTIADYTPGGELTFSHTCTHLWKGIIVPFSISSDNLLNCLNFLGDQRRPNLRRLSVALKRSGIHSQKWEAITKKTCLFTELVSLELNMPTPGPEENRMMAEWVSAEWLKPIEWCVESLNLNWGTEWRGMGDEVIKEVIEAFKRSPKLHSLQLGLRGTDFTNKGAEYIADNLLHCRALKSLKLDLTHNMLLGNEGIVALAHAILRHYHLVKVIDAQHPGLRSVGLSSTMTGTGELGLNEFLNAVSHLSELSSFQLDISETEHVGTASCKSVMEGLQPTIHTLTQLDLTLSYVTDVGIDNLVQVLTKDLPRIRDLRLDLQGSQLSQQKVFSSFGALCLVNLCSIPTLRSLSLLVSGNDIPDEAAIELLRTMFSARHLFHLMADLSDTIITDACLAAVSQPKAICRRLTSLVVKGNDNRQITNEGLSALTSGLSRWFPNLHECKLEFSECIDLGSSIKDLATFGASLKKYSVLCKNVDLEWQFPWPVPKYQVTPPHVV